MTNNQRIVLMECFDNLPRDLRDWINYNWYSVHNDEIMQGTKRIRQSKEFIENGGRPHFIFSENQN